MALLGSVLPHSAACRDKKYVAGRPDSHAQPAYALLMTELARVAPLLASYSPIQ
jgi:hypothetical protein